MYKIYTLNHPLTNEIRYVGQTCQELKSRLKKHLYCINNKKDRSHRRNWIKSLLDMNLCPKIVLIEENLDKEKCDILEKEYIKKFKELGLNLLNMTDGGEGSIGFKHTKETKEKLSIIRKNNDSKEYRKKISMGVINQWNNLSDEDKLNNIVNQINRKNIHQYDLFGNHIEEFISLRKIERDKGYFRYSILRCLKGIQKEAYGFIWKYD